MSMNSVCHAQAHSNVKLSMAFSMDISDSQQVDFRNPNTRMIKSKSNKLVPFLALVAAFIGQFVSEGVMISFTVLYPDLVEYFRASNSQISVVGSLTYGCWFLIGPVSGKLVDKFGPVKILMAAGTVGAIGCFLAMLATELWHITVTFGIICGTCCGLAFIPAITVVGGYFKKYHHLATTTATIGGAIGGVMFPLLMQAILRSYPWQFCFAATGLLMLQVVICGAVFHLKPDQLKSITAVTDHSKILLRVSSVDSSSQNDPNQELSLVHWRRNLILFALHNLLWNFGDFAFMTMLPLFLSHNGFSTDEIAYVISISSFATIFGRLVAAFYCLWPKADRILAYNLTTILSGIFLWLFCQPANLNLYFACAAGFGFMFGVQTALVPSVTIDLVGKERTNMALGVAIFASGLAGLSSPYAAGLLTDMTGDYCMTFWIASVLVMTSFFLMIHLHWPLSKVLIRCR